MNEKKNNGFAALILSLIVVVVAVLAVKFAGGTAANAVKPGPGPEVTPGESDAAPAGKYGVGTYTSTAKGFAGDVTVTITIGEGDVITEVTIVGENETAQLGSVAMEKLAAKIKEGQSVEVDAMTGATFTSNAVITAAADCMAQAEAAAGGSGAAEGEGEAAGAYKPGTYTATSKGFAGDVTATITIGEDGAIADVKFDGPNETAQLGGVALEKLQAKILDAQSAEVDVMSGATFSSKAAIAAAADCLAQAAN